MPKSSLLHSLLTTPNREFDAEHLSVMLGTEDEPLTTHQSTITWDTDGDCTVTESPLEAQLERAFAGRAHTGVITAAGGINVTRVVSWKFGPGGLIPLTAEQQQQLAQSLCSDTFGVLGVKSYDAWTL